MPTTDDARTVVRAYHDAWTGRRFDDAARLLAPDLAVEVPINDYPTAESFAAALAGFGALVNRVELLCELGEGGDAVLLYDLDVAGLGPLRVAEHFTVADGRITRIRQIHDTVTLCAAGFGPGGCPGPRRAGPRKTSPPVRSPVNHANRPAAALAVFFRGAA